jgi:hypothetical protein
MKPRPAPSSSTPRCRSSSSAGPLGFLGEVYDRAGYDLRIDYRLDPSPALPPGDREWARELFAARC